MLRSIRTMPVILLAAALVLTLLAPAAAAKDTSSGDKTDDKTYDSSKKKDSKTTEKKDKGDEIVMNVSAGAPCTPAGALGKTSKGEKMVCARTSDDPQTRWRPKYHLKGGFADTWGSGHAKDIEYIAKKGITKGCNPPNNTRFCPRTEVSRAEMAAFLVRALGLTDADHPGFKDVAKGSTFDQDIRKLAAAGITKGCNPPKNDRFCPDRAVSRAEMSAFLGRALELSKTSGDGTFGDVRSDSAFRHDINRLATAGLTKGCNPPKNDRFCPDRSVTREQMASFVERGLHHKK